MEPTKEQIKEFWEWCGFNIHPTQHIFPTIDLNNLFRYVVPQVRKYLNAQSEVGSIDTVKYPFHDFMKRWSYAVAIKDEDPALALFWAIWEVIHG